MKKSVRGLAVLTAAILLVGGMATGAAGSTIVAEAASTGLSCQFSGEDAGESGYAQGTITLTAGDAGTYRLFWADDQGLLDGFSRFAKLTMKAGESQSVKLGYHTAIPAGATRIVACKDGTDMSSVKAEYALPAAKRLSSGSGDLLYSFSAYSDIHIDKGSGWYVNAETHWQEGLEYASAKGADYIVVTGDCVTNDSGPDKEWKVYDKLLKQSSFTGYVWESDGNHDMRQDTESGLNSFIKYTGIDSTKEGFDNGQPYFYRVEEKTGDLFIFMALEQQNPAASDEFSNEQLRWASELLKEYSAKGVNIFLLQHSPIKGYGAGDRMNNPYYSGLLKTSYSSTKAFQDLLEQYPDIIWMSGHTHEDFVMDYNYSDENGKSANMIHIPSLAGSTMPNDTDDGLERNGGKGFHSQGYYVEVYENNIVYYGVNLEDETIYPQYSYIMDSPRAESHAIYNTEKAIASIGTDVSISSELSAAKQALDAYVYYASYDQFQYLKKLYAAYQGQRTADQSVQQELNRATAALKDIAEYTGAEKIYPLQKEYYFENDRSWSKVYAYAWTGSTNNGTWPGVKLDKCGTANGHDVYKVTFAEEGQYANLIFSNGSDQTVDIDLTKYKYDGFRTNGTSDGKYKVSNFAYTQQTTHDTVSLLYYISGVHGWSDTNTIMTRKDNGTYEYSFTASAEGNISFSLYNNTQKTYLSLPESAILAYEKGYSNSFSLVSQSSRGKSITLQGYAKGDHVYLTYDPANQTLTVKTDERLEEKPVNTSSMATETIILGEKAVIKASADGGTAPYTYTVKYKKSTSSTWTTKQSNGTKSEVAIQPSLAMDYNILVTVTDSAGQTADKTMTLHVRPALTNTSTVSKERIVIGQKFTVAASAVGGAGDYQYAVYYRKAGSSKWTTALSFGTANTVNIKPGAVMDYDVCVKVKDSRGTITKKYFTVTVAPKLSNTSQIDRTALKLGDSVTVTASAEGGAGNYRYAVYYKKASIDKWTEKQTYRANATVTIKPAAAVPYDVCVKVKDADGTIAKQYFKMTVTK